MNTPKISLVIPGKNAARTIERCLASVVPILESGMLAEILFVNDGSTDDTVDRVRPFPVRILSTEGLGPAGARNVGWRAAGGRWIWFIDSDCIANPDALAILATGLSNAAVAGVSGSYLNAEPHSYLAWLVHEEIVARHAAVGSASVSHLGAYNVLYRRRVLEEVGGFDEVAFPGVAAEDADLSFRVVDAGYELRLDPTSLVAHFHPTQLASYWRSQAVHGFWAVRLLTRHPRRVENSYNGVFENLQSPWALFCLLTLPGAAVSMLRPWVGLCWVALLLMTLPLTLRILTRTGSLRTIGYPLFSAARAFPRGIGMLRGMMSLATGGKSAPVRRS